MNNEIWKVIPIEGSNDLYEASNHGRVRSFCNRWGRLEEPKMLSPQLNGRGYLKVKLRVNNKTKNMYVHKCVILAFKGYHEKLKEVNHIDCDKLNNTPENLEWSSRSKNMKHAYRNGKVTIPDCRGERQGASKLTKKDVLKIRELSGGISQTKIGEMFGISQGHVSDIILKRRWSHV